jgi:sulfate transport system substrate-binding protein
MLKKTIATLFAAVALIQPALAAEITLTNVSYDPTRELYQDVDTAFAKQWKARNGEDLKIKASHGGSAKQARSVLDGLEADVVTLGLAYDIDELSRHGLLQSNWQSRLPHNASPYTSTVVLLVRKGNPKGIHDWSDLVKPGISVITANPKTSSGARWNYMAAYGYALRQPGGSEASARDFLKKLYKNVPVLDSGARGSTQTFVERGIGDVLIAWENEAFLAVKQLGPDKFDIVNPSISILAEPPVAVVDKNVDKHHTRKVAEAYLNYLYSDEGQALIAKNYYRPATPKAARQYASQFPSIKLFTLADIAGNWDKAQQTHFNDGGVFDQLYQAK